ncbi:uncharacterized protein LOC101854071 [Aplysia californica]|uniref:Uncharacterized protein LOC101854071 n=1 Tax=Aplysia californica TaxID=6500 RepID=A0ABM0ZVG1_APLCA|nr:uncharacterized protein LOC101854071 [Aplysia californica]
MDTKFLVLLALVASATAVQCTLLLEDLGTKESLKLSCTIIITESKCHTVSPTFNKTKEAPSLFITSPSSPNREEQFRRGVEASELRFSFQNGVVAQICSGQSEDAWVTNFKKGILSSFQNSMDDLTKAQNLTETDVAGECRTEYKLVSDGYYSVSIKKSKDILSCTKRHQYKTMLQMSPYNVPSEIQSLPIMKTTHECEQDIQKAGVLKSSTCTETHVYRPFANGNSGGMTEVKQTLTYRTSQSGGRSRPATIRSRDTLVFDHSASLPDTKMARVEAERRLRDICATSQHDVRSESPRQFSDLVSAMRSLSQKDLEDLHKLLKTKSLCPENEKTFKFFLDALPLTSTDASVKLMTSLITDKDVKGMLAQAWITSLGFVQAPTSDMLLNAKTLVDSEHTRAESLLPVSSMVNNYCRKMTSCDQDYAVLSVMASLERDIGYYCDASGKNFEKVLLSLRAIGNAGHATRAADVINRCLSATSNPLEIRVTAAEAFRRMPCGAKETELWNTYENGDLDSELRVAAYLALMRCPSDAILGKMAASLVNEEDDQVGSFVYSHLTNLRETSDPHKQDVARAVKNLALEKEFDLNTLKFSRNFEASTLLNKLNTGFTAESNLVWSSVSQMPRSVTGNLTIDLFGQAINLMDFGARLEGLEYLMKNLFGPYMPEEKKFKSPTKAEDVEGSVYGRVFGNEMFFMHSKTMTSPFKKLPTTWLDLLIQLSKKQDYTLTQSAQFMDVSMIIPTTAGLPIHIDVNGTGTLDLVLSGKMDLRKLGSSPRSLDIDGEIRPSAAVEISGSMSVDAMVTRTGLRMRNTLHTSTALKGRVQLERGQQLNLELDTPEDKMEIFNARSKFFILHNDVEQEQAMITENRQEFKMCSGGQLADLSGMELCGELTFANASMKTTGPYFPLTGPTSGSLTLYKRDSHKGYKIFAKRVENKKASIAQISLNTPGSKVDRAILLEIDVDYPKQSLDAIMRTPWKKAAVRGVAINSDELKSFTGSVVIDDVDTYALTTEVKVDKSKGKLQLSPMVELRRAGAENVQLTGHVTLVKPFKSADVDLSVSGLSKMPYNLQTSVINTKKEKSIQASFSPDGQRRYTLEASNQVTVMGKKSTIAILKSLLKVNTPTKQVMSLTAGADYREAKSLKLDGTLDVYRLLKKPASVQLSLVKSGKKRTARYDVEGSLKSSGVSGKLDSYTTIKDTGFVSTKSILSYSIPKVAKNKITLGGKLNDRSTKSYKKYTLKSTLDIAKNPEYNLGLDLSVDHKKKHSEAEVELKYGPNPKDKTKRLFWSSSFTKKQASWKNADLSFKMNALAPAHGVDVSVMGQHEHNPKMLDSNVMLNYGGKGKDLSAQLAVKDKSSKLAKINGKAVVAWPGSAYTLTTDFDQKSEKKYVHEMNLKDNSGMKHAVTTIYKTPKGNAHELTTKFMLEGVKPITVIGSTNLDLKNFEVSGEIQKGTDTYGLKTKSKVSKASSANVVVELVYPARRMTLLVDGGKQKNKFNGRVEAAWDADKDKSQTIVIDGSGYMKASKKSTSLGGDIKFNSPFENYEDIMTAFKYGSDDSQHDLSGKLSWGGKGKQVVSSLTVKNPISLSNLKMVAEAKSPFKGFRVVSVDVDHSMEPTLKTVLKGRWEKENGKLTIEGENLGDLYRRNIKGSVALKSTVKNAEDIKLSLSHSDGSGRVSSNAALIHNGKPYGYDMNMIHSQNGWQVKNSGDLVLTMPNTNVKSSWNHKNGDKYIKSTLTSDWGKNRLLVDLDGSQDLLSSGALSGDVKIQTPWRSFRSVDLSLSHKQGQGLILNKASLKQNGQVQASSTLNYNGHPSGLDIEFALTSPYHEDINGKVNSKHSAYPMTGMAEISWSPRSKAVMEGSVNVASWESANVDLKLITPLREYRNIVFKASNKGERGEMVSHMNLDYGVRKNIDLESRMVYGEAKKMLRLRMTTPFEQMKSLDTGLAVTGVITNFDGSADFEMYPAVGKFQGSLNWQYADNLKANLRLETPFPEYPYIELSTSSQMTGRSRQSYIAAEYSPRQRYSLDSTYTFEMPYSFEATISSPVPEYDNLGLTFQHSHSPSKLVSHGELRYQPSKKIEGDVNVDWSDLVEGTVMLKTPFEGYETSKVMLRHQGDMDAFSSHGEVNVADKSVSADASFNSGYTTTGTFTFNSPISGLESVEISLNKRGNSKNIRGGATLVLNGDRSQASFNHKMKDGALKSTFSFSSPNTETFKVSIDHNGALDSFTNKMSLNYGRRYDIDTILAFDHRQPDISGNGMIKYKLAGPRNVARVTFSKTGEVEDMAFSGTVSYNREDIGVQGSWKLLSGMQGSIQVSTPFDDFRNIGAVLIHNGDSNNFKTESSVTYMDGQSITGKVDLSSNGLSRVRFNTEVVTPFTDLQRTMLSAHHDYDEYTLALSGGATLTTTIGQFGQGSVTYSKSGDLDNFSVQLNGKYADDEAIVSATKSGSLDDLTVSGSASYNGQAISMDGSLNTFSGIDGSVQVKTPFTDFRNVGMKLSHHGPINDFKSETSLDYMDNKNVNSHVEFSADGLRDVKLSAEVNTPRELLGSSKLTLNHKIDAYRTSVSSKGNLRSSIGGFGRCSFQLSTTGDLKDLSMEGKATHNGQDIIDTKITNSLQSRSLNTAVSVKSFVTPDVELTVDHSGVFLNSNTKAQAVLGSDNVLSLVATVSNSGDVLDGQGQLNLRSMDYGSSQGSLTVHKEGKIDDFSMTVTTDLNNDKFTVTGAMKVKDEITGSVKLQTPIRGYRNVGVSFRHSGNLVRFNTNGDVTLTDDNRYSAKLDFYRSMLQRFETTLEVTTPIRGHEFTKYEYRHEGGPDSFKCYKSLEYGNSQKITYDLQATISPDPNLSVTLKTPFDMYEDLSASASLVNNWPVASISGKVNAGNGNVVALNGALDVSSDISGSLSVTTPLDDFSDVGLSFQHSGDLNNFNSEGRVTYMDNKDVSGKLRYKRNGARIVAELKTPVTGYELTRFEYKENNNQRKAFSEGSLLYGDNQVLQSTVKIVYPPNPEMMVTLKTPIRNYEDISVSYSLDTKGPQYKLESNANMGNGRSVTLNGGCDSSDDISAYATLNTPVSGYRNLGVDFHHSGNDQKFTTQGKITYADNKDISGKVNFYRYMWRRVTASAELSAPFSGLENTKGEVNFEDRSTSMSASSSLQYGSDQKLDGSVKLTYSPNYDLLVTINTPFDDLRNVRAVATADLNAPSYMVTSGLVYGYNKAYSANGKLNLFSAQRLDASLEVQTPITGLERTKVEYNHNVDSSSIQGSTSLAYENGRKTISAELQSSIYPSLDASVTVKTPVYGYSSVQGALTYDSSYNKYEASSSLKVEGRSLYTMNSGLDYSVEPIRVFAKISTPHTDFRNVELVLTHEGQFDNFKCTGFLASPLTDNVNAQASLDYKSPYDMSLSTSVKSSLAGMDDLKFELKNSDIAGEKKMSAVAGWTDGQQVQTDVMYRSQETWYEDKTHADVSLSTPFAALRSLAVQTEQTRKSQGREGKLAIDMNGAQLLDVSGEYSSKDKHEASLTFNRPWPMQYSASGFNTEGHMEADVMANWNRDDLTSNVHLVAVVNDKSDDYVTDRAVDMSVERSSRKMGVSHTQKVSGSQLTSTGKMFWDSGDEDKVSYDLTVTDNSRRNKDVTEGSLKLGLPFKTLELSGSMSDSPAAKTADATFSWDAERDSSKQVGVKATMRRGKSLRGDITLNMPSIRKEIRVDGELMLNNGRIILDSKTDISYSSDASKTLTLTSKVQDISDYYSNYNYSVELGLSHPYTNIDLKMTSHLGSSDERMTVGVETSYLTARRQTKNLALLAEINKLKRQISVQMSNPMNKIEIMGDVVSTSPSKLRLLNRIDDAEVFRSELTVDSDKKSAEISIVMDSEKFSLHAQYPNSSAFRAYASHWTPEVSHQEALLALRLNTTRLLHSHLHWRPALWAELTAGVEERAARAGVKSAEMWELVNEAVADEISGKYRAVSSSLDEELTPLIDALEGQFNNMAYKMADMSRELRAMYQRNDFHVQGMGDTYMTLQSQFESMTTEYRRGYTELIQSLRHALAAMLEFPARERYTQLVESGMSYLAERVYSSLSCLEEYTARLEKDLQEYKHNTKKWANSVADTVHNTSYVDYIANRFVEVKNVDISPYITSIELPEEYSNAIYSARDSAVSGMKDLWERPEIDIVRGNLNKVYQQGSWAYKYWNVEENLKKNLGRAMTLLREIVEEELKEMTTEVKALYQNPITVWMPEQGEIQAQLALPFDLQRLDQVPDVSPLVNKVEEIGQEVVTYLPDHSTWEDIKQTVSGLWPVQEEGQVEPLGKYQTSRQYRQLKRGGRKVNKMRKYGQ